MRILIVNTTEKTGGAAVAAYRLMEALNNNGVKAKMLVRDKETQQLTVCALPSQGRARWLFLWERFIVWLNMGLRRKHLFEVDIANCGTDITLLHEFQEADVIHLHWVNQGMLSLKDIRKILERKPVVWTMHDLWPAAAICHLSFDCRKFETHCEQCQLQSLRTIYDLASHVWRQKQKMLHDKQVSFVACSQWLASEANKSALLKGQRVYSIPNPIDTRLFRPGDRQSARQSLGLPLDKRVILFASQRVTNVNKGMNYLIEACRLLADRYPESVNSIVVAILGGHAEEITGLLPFPTYPLGYINDHHRIVSVYQASDVFVLPSLSENLPNTIMEAMACGVPSVGFRVGGIPEEIDHQENGYIAQYRDAQDLAEGIWWTLDATRADAVRKACIQKVCRCYSQQSVANRYIEVYQTAMNTQATHL